MQKIGKYEIREQLGRGGMGTVYRAYDPVMDREVALKVILDLALDVPEIKERFYREARTAGKLSHENITIVHDVGEENGRPYIVMEYLSGSDLRTLLERRVPMSAEQKLAYATQICRGLAYSHGRDVVHRDVKPANIRILDDGRVKIMDFGIARLGSSALTSTGAVLGTPYYMSPEQIQGKKVDRRADIFSCGVLLFELFTSEKPFRGEEPTSVMYKIVHEEPEGIDDLTRVYPPQLAGIIAAMLRKDPAARYQSLEEVVRALEAVQADLQNERARGGKERLGAEASRPGEVCQAETILGTTPPPAPPASRFTVKGSQARLLWVGAAAAVIIAAVLFLGRPSAPMGAVALNVLPWAEVATIAGDSTGAVPLEATYITPCRIPLPPGSYTVTCTHPREKKPLVFPLVIHQDSLTEVTKQWPGYDAEKILARF